MHRCGRKSDEHSITIKLTARGQMQGSHRRMLGDVSVQFDEISPLNEKDLELARKNAQKGGTYA